MSDINYETRNKTLTLILDEQCERIKELEKLNKALSKLSGDRYDYNKKLEYRLSEADKVIGFYGEFTDYQDVVKYSNAEHYLGQIPNDDDFEVLPIGSDSCVFKFGKRARDYLSKQDKL